LSGDLALQESVVMMNLRAVACLPLLGMVAEGTADELLGILYLDSTRPMHALSGLDEKILAKLAEEAGRVLEKLQLIRGIEERKLIEHELVLARETQANLLPRRLPELEGFVIRALSRPSRYVGGDFYDFVKLGDDGLVGLVADVSGKGISAALLSSSLQGAVQMQFRSGLAPEAALAAVNAYLCERSEEGRFATLFLFVLDRRGAGRFVNAGHNPSYLYRAKGGEVEELATGDMILGAFESATYASRPLEMRQGDLLVVYSDGLTEAASTDGRAFTEERLLALIREHASRGARAVEAALLGALDAFTAGTEQTDDITLVLVERNRPEMPTIG
jgi:serine phosphatase RsbU (regulator of sigma subunit)